MQAGCRASRQPSVGDRNDGTASRGQVELGRGHSMATLAAPLAPSQTFRPSRRVDPRLWVGGGLGIFAAIGVLVTLNQVVPSQQEVLQLTHDLPAGAIVQAADLTSVRVRI